MIARSARKVVTLLFRELPYFVFDFVPFHGQFKNSLCSPSPTKKYLDKPVSMHDLDLFSLNTDANINPDFKSHCL